MIGSPPLYTLLLLVLNKLFLKDPQVFSVGILFHGEPPLLDAPFPQQKMTTIPHVVPCRNTGSLSRAALEVPDTSESDRRDMFVYDSGKIYTLW